MVGFATLKAEGFNGTTGGEGGTVVHATSLDDIHAFVEEYRGDCKKILIITKSIKSPESFQFIFRNGSNLTIRGEEDVILENFGFFFNKYNNVIIENLTIKEVFYPNDPVTINNGHHYYIRNNEFHSQWHDGIGKDTYDGLIDMKRGARYITIDGNYFHDHNKAILIGHTDDLAYEVIDKRICVTICNNYFNNIGTRCPSIRYGTLHVFNNKYEDIPEDYAIAGRLGARVLIENNEFINVEFAATDKFPGKRPRIKLAESNKYYGLNDDRREKFLNLYKKQLINFNDCGFIPPYEYKLNN